MQNFAKASRRSLLALVTVVAVATAAPSASLADSNGQLIVGFDQGTSASEERAAVQQADTTVTDEISGLDIAVVTPDPGQSKAGAINQLQAQPNVKYVQPNYTVHASVVPNDTSFYRQWGLENTGAGGSVPGADIGATSAWDSLTSSNVVVAVVDTGIDYTHPDLTPNIWTNSGEIADNGIDDDDNGYIDDTNGYNFNSGNNDPYDDSSHGTHVAGIIGAVGNNNFGVAGVAWSVKLMPVKFLDSNGGGSTADAISAIRYAANNGAKVINASWGSPDNSPALSDAITSYQNSGGVFVAAAGNEGTNNDTSPEYPASFPQSNIVSVAASDRTDNLSTFSDYGSLAVDIGAPGSEIYSTVPGGYETYSGTSMAAPFVSGAVALYMQKYPGATPAAVRNAVISSARPVAGFSGTTVSGGVLNLPGFLNVTSTGLTQTNKNPLLKIKSVKRSRNLIVLKGVISKDVGTGNITAVATRGRRSYTGRVTYNKSKGSWKARIRVRKAGRYTVNVTYSGGGDYRAMHKTKAVHV